MHIRKSLLALAVAAASVPFFAHASEGASTSERLKHEVREGASSVGEFANDALITTKVKTALVGEDSIRALDISVETRDNVVHLTGAVDTPEQRETAERLARETADVKDVVNEIRLKQQ